MPPHGLLGFLSIRVEIGSDPQENLFRNTVESGEPRTLACRPRVCGLASLLMPHRERLKCLLFKPVAVRSPFFLLVGAGRKIRSRTDARKTRVADTETKRRADIAGPSQ